MATMRLDRLLGSMGYGSRSQIAQLALADQVLLDGKPLRDAAQRVGLASDLPARMTVQGQPLDPMPGLCLMLNKPLGMSCSRKEDGALVFDLLPSRWLMRDPAISTVGRLDKQTSGLLLMTDDGQLLHRIISPKRHVAKVYRAQLARPMDGSEASLFASGELMLEGEDKPLKPAELEVVTPTEARLTVHEGRYHQVRRMFAATGNHVEALHREQVGGLCLPVDLEPGQWRLMAAADIDQVFADPGGPA